MTHPDLIAVARRIERPVTRLAALVTACAGGARDGHGNPIGRPDELFHRILATHAPQCLVAQDRDFIESYMRKIGARHDLPAPHREIFGWPENVVRLNDKKQP